MRALRFIALPAVLAALLILPVTNRTVHSIVQEQDLAADQANVASVDDATFKTGDVDLEGVPEDDTTSYSFSSKEDATDAATDGQAAETAKLSCAQPRFSRPKTTALMISLTISSNKENRRRIVRIRCRGLF